MKYNEKIKYYIKMKMEACDIFNNNKKKMKKHK